MSIEDPEVLGFNSDEIETVCLFLTETNWAEPITQIKEQRNQIAEMLKINLDNLVKIK
jgi:hypothetical protein